MMLMQKINNEIMTILWGLKKIVFDGLHRNLRKPMYTEKGCHHFTFIKFTYFFRKSL